jgi:hypothetical protein
LFGQSERLPLDFVTIRDFFHAFSSAANLTQTGSYHAQVHSASDLLQLPIKVSHRRHSVHHPGSQSACRITQGAGSLPCALRVTASQNVRPHIRLRFDFLFVLTIEIASYSQNPGRFALKRTSGIAAKPAGLNTAEDQMSTYRPVDSASVMGYQGRWLTGRQYPIAMSRLRTPADGSLGAALHGRSRFHRKPRNVIIPNWHSTQS